MKNDVTDAWLDLIPRSGLEAVNTKKNDNSFSDDGSLPNQLHQAHAAACGCAGREKAVTFGRYNVGAHEVVGDCVAEVRIAASSLSADLLDVHDPVQCTSDTNRFTFSGRF